MVASIFTGWRNNVGKSGRYSRLFWVGAHAVIADAALITRDAACYRSSIPGSTLIAPN
jgi:predicted nucleic acid-binding protein